MRSILTIHILAGSLIATFMMPRQNGLSAQQPLGKENATTPLGRCPRSSASSAAGQDAVLPERISPAPKYGCNFSGIRIEPSGCWQLSINAANSLGSARPEPFNVWQK